MEAVHVQPLLTSIKAVSNAIPQMVDFADTWYGWMIIRVVQRPDVRRMRTWTRRASEDPRGCPLARPSAKSSAGHRDWRAEWSTAAQPADGVAVRQAVLWPSARDHPPSRPPPASAIGHPPTPSALLGRSR
jgi:hypothetical protein